MKVEAFDIYEKQDNQNKVRGPQQLRLAVNIHDLSGSIHRQGANDFDTQPIKRHASIQQCAARHTRLAPVQHDMGKRLNLPTSQECLQSKTSFIAERRDGSRSCTS